MKIKPINFLFLLLFIYLSCKETHSETKEDFELKNFNFELKNNILTTENGIDKISYLEIKSDNIISFREDGYEIIKFHEQKIYAGNRNEDELFIIDTTGTIFNIIDTKHKDITVPNRIRDFTLTNENLIIFEQMTNKLYYYSLDGQLTKVESDPDTSMIISTISFLRPNHLVLQKYHDGSNFSIKRNQTLVGKVLNLSNKKLRPIYYDGGSQSRDYFISMRFTEINDGILYNYRYGKEFFLINEQKDLKLLTFDSKDLLTNDFIQEVDNMIPHKAADVFNDQYRKNNKIDNFHFYYMHNNIFFFTTFWNNNFYWVFYNSVKDQYKTMKFQPMTIYTHKGVPFKPYVKNAKDNYFMVFLDGQEMQQTNSNIEFNSNSPYFIKIYPKYLNQEAWE